MTGNGNGSGAEDGGGAGRRKAEALAAALGEHGFQGAAFACALETDSLRVVGRRGGTDDALPVGTRLLPVCAIARPAGFLADAGAAATAAGMEVTAPALTFRDHHDYPEASLEKIRRAAAEGGAGAVLTTTKDGVKLRGRLGLPLVELPVRARPEATFWSWLDGRLGRLTGATGGAGEVSR